MAGRERVSPYTPRHLGILGVANFRGAARFGSMIARGELRESKGAGMADEALKNTQTLMDDEIVTERKVARRAFLSSSGVLLAGGALAVVAGARAMAQDGTPQQADPDKPRDPDKRRDPDKPRDPDRPRDPDKARESDKPRDPDKAPPPPPPSDQAPPPPPPSDATPPPTRR